MVHTGPGEVTALLEEYNLGSSAALERLIISIYPDLRRMARRLMSGERMDHTLSPTALVHEGFLRLFVHGRPELKNRKQLFLTAAKVMQHVLTDHARKKLAGKRNGDIELRTSYPPDVLLAIAQMLDRLEATDTRAAKVVQLRFYMGMTDQEAAAALDTTPAIVQQDWQWARAWLRAETHGAWGSRETAVYGSGPTRRN